jgi:hypothetical protein
MKQEEIRLQTAFLEKLELKICEEFEDNYYNGLVIKKHE